MNQHGTELLDSFDRLSLSSLSKSSPSTFSLKSSRTSSKSSNLSHVPCKFFKQGTCTAGANCIFSHNPDPTSESSVCKYFRKGNCKFGTKCALLHTMSPYTSTNSKSQPPQQPTNRFPFEGSHSVSQDRDYFLDPFASSAPSQSPFSLLSLSDERLRLPQLPQQSSSNHDPMVQLMGTSPFQQRPLFNGLHQGNANRIIQQQQPSQLHSIPENNNHTFEDQEFFDDVNDFMLPSSLNDLLTPTELRKQQQFPSYLSSSSTSTSRQPSFEPMGTSSLSSSWNVPFYSGSSSHGPITNHGSYGYDDTLLDTPQQPYFSNAINIPGGQSGSSRAFSYQGYFSSSTTTSAAAATTTTTTTSAALTLDEDGPFIMEDTIESSTITNDTPKVNKNENYPFNHIIQQNL